MEIDREENGVRYVTLTRLMCPGYEVGDDGTVIGERLKRPLKPYPHEKTGRAMVALKDWRRRRKTFALARLVLDLFRGKRDRGWEPHHRDGDVMNCELSNLRWKKKRTPKREAARCMVQGIIRRYKFTTEELFPGGS